MEPIPAAIRFACDAERAYMLGAAVALVNSCVVEATDPILEINTWESSPGKVWVRLGYKVVEHVQAPPTFDEALAPYRDAVHYLEQRPEPPDDLRLKEE
jgi:hypothetical protein